MLILIVFLAVACGGVAMGGEECEYMPLRGNGAGADVVEYNDVRLARAASALRPAAATGKDNEFMKWKNHCSAEPAAARKAITEDSGFSRVSPYLSKPIAKPGGFFEALGLE